MKALNYKIVTFVLIFVASIASAQDSYNKKFHESYPVDKNCTFDITNKFGNIVIENTDENQITIDAEIIVKTGSKDKADRIMDKISVTIKKEGNTITALTELDNINNANFEINYQVLMPTYLNINLLNKYGKVTINELRGNSNLEVKYGSLDVNKILDDNEKPLSSVTLGYCESSEITEFNWGKILIRYSKLEVEKGKALAISSKYSHLKLGDFSSLVAEAGYDDYKINSTNNLVMEAKYTKVQAEKLTKKLNIENKYGNIEVAEIPKGFESIDVVSKYATIELGIADDASYMLDAETNYADVKYNDLKITERVRESSATQVKGTAGDSNTKATVKIRSEYGDVDLRP